MWKELLRGENVVWEVLCCFSFVIYCPSSQLVLPVSSFLLCVSTRFYENGFAGQMKKMANFESR